MSETQTVEALNNSLESGLSSIFNESSNPPVSETTTEKAPETQDQAPRGQPDTMNQNGVEQPKAESTETSASTQDATNPQNQNQQPQNQPQPKRSKYQERIKELTDKIKELEAKVPQAQQPVQQAQQGQQGIEEVIPKPQAPQYSKDQLKVIRQKAIAEQDQGLLDAVDEQLEKWRQYEIDERLWKVENKQALERKQGEAQYYYQEAVKKWPDLAKNDSELAKGYNHVKSLYEKAKANPGLLDYYLADISNELLKSKSSVSRVGALEKENESLRKELDSLKKKFQPSVPRHAPAVGNVDSEAVDPAKELRQRMQELAASGKLG